MKEYGKRSRLERSSRAAGLFLTLAVHIGIVIVCLYAGLTYLDPPPPEQSMLLDFDDVLPPDAPELKFGKEPSTVKPDPKKPVELVQRSEGQTLGTKINQAQESTVGNTGDVEIPEPPRDKEINRRALFPSADNTAAKDTLAAQTASEISDRIRRGIAGGTASESGDNGIPNARLEGREPIDGCLPMPQYNSRDYGTVVVTIWVMQDGTVQKAETDVARTNVTDRNLWRAAETAARNSKFRASMNAPTLQEGTITYKFVLK